MLTHATIQNVNGHKLNTLHSNILIIFFPKQKGKIKEYKVTKMLSRTVVSVSAVSSTSPSRFLCKVNPTIPRFLGLKKLPHNFTNCTTWNKDLNLNRKCSTRMDNFTTKASAAAQPLTNADELIGSVETFIFDCDGLCFSLALKFLVNSFLRIKKEKKSSFFFHVLMKG